MSAIVDFANQLSAVNTEGVEATSYVVPLKNVLREDVPETGVSRDALLQNAKTHADGYVTVPRVVES